MSGRAGRWLCGVGAVALAWAVLGLAVPARSAEPAEDRAVPADTAILEVDVPAKTQVVIDGEDQGDRRVLRFRPLRAGQRYRCDVKARFPGGGEVERKVLFQGGWRFILPLRPPDVSRPGLVEQSGHTLPVFAAALSPDGRLAATASQDRTIILWDVASGLKVRTLQRHVGHVVAVAFSPDGKQVLSGARDRAALLWDVSSGEAIRPIRMGGEEVQEVAFSPDGKQVLIALKDRTVYLHDAATGKRAREFRGHTGDIYTIAFRPDGGAFLTGGEDGAILWDAATGKKLHTFAGPMGRVAFSPDGKRLLTGTNDGIVGVWDAATGEKLRTLEGLGGAVQSIAFSPDGKRILGCCAVTDAILVWDAATGRELRRFPATAGWLWGGAASADGKHLLTRDAEGRAFLWDVEAGRLARTFQGHTRLAMSAAFSPDGRRLASASYAGDATVWDLEAGRPLHILKGHQEAVSAVCFRPDGRRLLTASWDASLRLWDPDTGQPVRTFDGLRRQTFRDPTPAWWHAFTGVALSPDGKRLLTGSNDNTARLRDAASGRTLHVLAGHTDEIWTVAYSPDGSQVLTGSKDRTAILWDARTGRTIRTFRGHTGEVGSVAFRPDGAQVLTGSADKTAILWDARTGGRLRTFKGHTDAVGPAAFSPDGRLVLTGSDDRTARLWDAATGRVLRTFEGHTDELWSAAWHPDGRQVLTGSKDGTAVVWDVETGAKVRTFQAGECQVFRALFSPDGKYVATGRSDERTILWDAATGERVATFHEEGRNALDFSRDGRFLVIGGRQATLWELRDEQGRLRQGHTGGIVSAAFSPDGRRILTGGRDGTAILWDAENGRPIRTLRGHSGLVYSVAFRSEGEQVATGSEDKTVILWDARTGRPLRTIREHTDQVGAVAFSPDGKQLLTGGFDQKAFLWDAASGRLLSRIATGGRITAVAFSPDGRSFLTGRGDRPLILWGQGAEDALRLFEGHAGPLTAVAFAPDGRRVLSTSYDGSVRLWDIATGDELIRLFSLDGGKDWVAVTPEGLFDGSEGGRQKVAYRIGSGLTVVPVDRFFQDFYRPGLLASLWRGERTMPEVEIGKSRAPTVRIVAPAEGGSVESSRVTLDVAVTDEGGGVKGPRLLHNGSRVLAPGEAEKQGKVVRRRFEVALVEGDNRLEVTASSGDGSWDSEPARLLLRYEKPLTRPDLYVLAAGVSRYAEGSLDLKYAAADARDLSDLFRRRGQALYAKVHIQSLVDGEATREGIRAAFAEMARQAQARDTLVVFLAGHGSMVGQRYFFLPHDFKRREGKEVAEDVRASGLAADVLGDYLAAVPALKRVLIFDTCHSGGAVGLGRSGRSPFAFRGAIERLSRAQGLFTLAAAAAGEEAQEVKELGHGVLTYALLAGLGAVREGPLAGEAMQVEGKERVASVLEWFNFASGQVPRLTRKYFGREQDVQMGGQGSSFPILPIEER
jgi:WD40 repeat protein